MTLVSLVAILLLWAMRDFNSPNFSIPPLPYLFPIFPLCTCLCLLFAPYSILWKRLFERKAFYYLSVLSYGLYLWHNLFLSLVWKLPLFSKIHGLQAQWLIATTIAYTTALVVSALSWKLFEKPIISWAQRIK